MALGIIKRCPLSFNSNSSRLQCTTISFRPLASSLFFFPFYIHQYIESILKQIFSSSITSILCRTIKSSNTTIFKRYISSINCDYLQKQGSLSSHFNHALDSTSDNASTFNLISTPVNISSCSPFLASFLKIIVFVI